MKKVLLLSVLLFIFGKWPCSATAGDAMGGEEGSGRPTGVELPAAASHAGDAAAATEGTIKKGPTSLEGEPRLEIPGTDSLNAFHDYFSKNVEALSQRIDAFFGARRIYEEYSGTYVQLRGSVIYRRFGGPTFDGNLRARFVLPNLEQRFNLLFESYSDDDLEENPLITSGTRFSRAVEDKKLAASLQYVVESRERLDVRVQPGIKFKVPPDPFVRFRFRWLKPLGAVWLSRTTVIPGWFASDNGEARGRLDLERSAGDGTLFRSSSEAFWELDERRNLVLTQSFFFAHPLGRLVQVAYEAGVSGEIDPHLRDTGYFASIRYRRNIHQGWLFLEIKPQIAFDRENGFRADPSLALTLEMLCGGNYR